MCLCRMGHVTCVGCALCVIVCDVSCNTVCGITSVIIWGDACGLMVSVRVVCMALPVMCSWEGCVECEVEAVCMTCVYREHVCMRCVCLHGVEL